MSLPAPVRLSPALSVLLVAFLTVFVPEVKYTKSFEVVRLNGLVLTTVIATVLIADCSGDVP